MGLFFRLDVIYETAGIGTFLNEAGQRMRMENIARRQVFNRAGRSVDFQNVVGGNFLHVVANLKERQPDIYSIAIKNSRETRRYNYGDSGRLDCNGRMFAA